MGLKSVMAAGKWLFLSFIPSLLTWLAKGVALFRDLIVHLTKSKKF